MIDEDSWWRENLFPKEKESLPKKGEKHAVKTVAIEQSAAPPIETAQPLIIPLTKSIFLRHPKDLYLLLSYWSNNIDKTFIEFHKAPQKTHLLLNIKSPLDVNRGNAQKVFNINDLSGLQLMRRFKSTTAPQDYSGLNEETSESVIRLTIAILDFLHLLRIQTIPFKQKDYILRLVIWICLNTDSRRRICSRPAKLIENDLSISQHQYHKTIEYIEALNKVSITPILTINNAFHMRGKQGITRSYEVRPDLITWK